jgi:tetratricopeptide (TPR) repeat protein
VLITTRQRQQAPDTWQDVAPLPTPDSLALLRAWAGRYAIDDTASGEIVRLLGGLPLALKLAGRYLAQQQQPAAEFAAGLQEEGLAALQFAERPSKSIPLLLQRSLAQVSTTARAAYGVAGVLALAPFDHDEVVAALDLMPTAAGRALGELVDYGLLLRTADGYTVSHALAHAYARTAAAPEPQVIERLAWYYSGWVQKESIHGLAESGNLDRRRAHILAVQAAALAREQWMPVIALAWSLRTYLDLRAHTIDRVTVMQAGLDAAQGANRQPDEEAFLNSLGLAYVAFGSFQPAIDLFRQRLRLAEQRTDPIGKQIAFSNLGAAYAALGQYPCALLYFKRVLKLAQRTGERKAIGSASGNIGGTYLRLGKVQDALPLFERQLAIAGELQQRREEANAFGNLAIAYAQLGQMDRVVELLEQQLFIARELGDRHSEGIALGNLGGAFAGLGDQTRAIALHGQYLAIARETHDRMGEGIALGNLGKEYAALDDTHHAIDMYEQSLTVARTIGDRQTEAVTSWNLGLAYEKEGDLARAITYLQARVDYERTIGHPEAAAHAAHVADVQARLNAGVA